MGREVRMVPPDWEHPKDEAGHDIPLRYSRDLAGLQREWDEGQQKWDDGFVVDYVDGGYKPLDESVRSETFEEYHGLRPVRSEYLPQWTPEEATHYRMYETTSEGSPISPAFATPELLARWLADSNASAFAGQGATYEEWLSTIHRGSAISAVIYPGRGIIESGVAGEHHMGKSK